MMETNTVRRAGRTLAMAMMAVFVTGARVPPQSAEEVLEQARQKYQAVQDAEIKFVQSVRFTVANIRQQTSGTLFLKKTNKYRLETEGQTIVTDGITVWSYSASTDQVLIDRFAPDDRTFTPERLFEGGPSDFTSSLLGTERGKKGTLHVIKLIPKDDHSFITSLKLWIDDSDWLTRKAEVIDANGKETLYTVEEIRVNTGLRDSKFSFDIPAGADVVDMR
jgi:outer membrane lipoprotein carrier protein